MAETYEKCDCVYAGKRLATGGKLASLFFLVDAAGNVDESRRWLFTFPRNAGPCVVGGLYTGAEFSATGAKGLQGANFVRMLDDKQQRMEWFGAQALAESEKSNLTAERNARAKANDIEKVMAPLTKAYNNAKSFEARRGLELLVLDVLKNGKVSP